ncbi:hypothetical protein GUJ93_ZPchr0012g19125 [Zizania palustris]|uniref:Uncharacterized protein n=1 Tax=Zizania palustris TaxID=103762 RepID=A0A8J5WMT6_ZIZPA|nr:hypothetical protein GUJ93_ZPchr0012g19125 [Zizania palustris]
MVLDQGVDMDKVVLMVEGTEGAVAAAVVEAKVEAQCCIRLAPNLSNSPAQLPADEQKEKHSYSEQLCSFSILWHQSVPANCSVD